MAAIDRTKGRRKESTDQHMVRLAPFHVQGLPHWSQVLQRPLHSPLQHLHRTTLCLSHMFLLPSLPSLPSLPPLPSLPSLPSRPSTNPLPTRQQHRSPAVPRVQVQQHKRRNQPPNLLPHLLDWSRRVQVAPLSVHHPVPPLRMIHALYNHKRFLHYGQQWPQRCCCRARCISSNRRTT
ncbi:unnamed protein product [Closterium sp. NIES-53]